MDTTIWTYPWDMVDRDPDRAAQEIADTGLGAVSLAATYHTFDQIRPNAPGGARFLSSDRSSAYYPFDPAAFDKALVPHRGSFVSGPEWEDCASSARDAGLSVVAWTLFLHNSHLATTHPELAQVTCTGDRYLHQLCPSCEPVRTYAKALATDICKLDVVDILECESIGYGGYGHTHYHPKVGIDPGAGGRFLLSLCFCESCTSGARTSGVDIDSVRIRSAKQVESLFETGEAVRESPEELLSQPDTSALMAWRERQVTTLIRDVAASARKPIRVLSMGEPHISGLNVSSVAPHIDAVEYLCYTSDTTRISKTIEKASKTTGSMERVGVGLQAYPPAASTAAELRASYETAREAGVRLVSFYNYGIMPRRNLHWIRQVVSTS